ncbi:branched-chain amino acid transaminase [Egibacter rhizosphaerae]|uniref:Branched-chain-amino-acid aminotransferase n=1 Tax=Egibacter rhizosphaerae TaxID=1670831 RepID=A0A411YFS3_9ACTN|nr:branched-chain amino acid transaminase [Egibacter rhizosphaerae]QBI20080.1 branched-chain amino acid transaminase [Egibacter rhizosphaerae]
MQGTAYFDGEFIDLREAKVSVRSHAFNYGISVFEGIRGYWVEAAGEVRIFRLEDHLRRMVSSAKLLQMNDFQDVEWLTQTCCDLIRRGDFRENVYLRPILYKDAPDGLGVRLDRAPDAFLAYLFPQGDYVPADRPLRVGVGSWRRLDDNAIPARGKIGGAYVNAALAKTEAVQRGYDECVMLTQAGTVAEGSTENIFLVDQSGKLVTPTTTDDILVGITRDTVMHLARQELDLEVEERVVDRSELYRASEVFLCGTGAEIAAAGEIDERQVGTGKIGPVTQRLRELYAEAVRGQLAGYEEWNTRVTLPRGEPG